MSLTQIISERISNPSCCFCILISGKQTTCTPKEQSRGYTTVTAFLFKDKFATKHSTFAMVGISCITYSPLMAEPKLES